MDLASDVAGAPVPAPRVPYAWCPACAEVTPHVLAFGSNGVQELVVGCGPCGRLHAVIDEAQLITDYDTTAVHDGCGTTVACPSSAHRVRCPLRSCKRLGFAYFPGPALRS